MITDEHRANLATLADFLERHVPPPTFDIGSYAQIDVAEPAP